MTHHLAQLNIARMRTSLDDPAMADFVENLDPVNALAEGSPGYVWRLQTEEGNATGVRIYDDDALIVNMSVWESLEALRAFVASEAHMRIVRRGSEWFEAHDLPYLVLWWVPEGHRPTILEAQERLDHLREHGPTERAFTFGTAFPEPS